MTRPKDLQKTGSRKCLFLILEFRTSCCIQTALKDEWNSAQINLLNCRKRNTNTKKPFYELSRFSFWACLEFILTLNLPILRWQACRFVFWLSLLKSTENFRFTYPKQYEDRLHHFNEWVAPWGTKLVENETWYTGVNLFSIEPMPLMQMKYYVKELARGKDLPSVSRLQTNLELILTSFFDDYFIRANSFLPPHFALTRYAPHILRKISESHHLGPFPCSTAPTRLSTHSNESIFKFFTVTLDLDFADVHCDPRQVNWLVARHVIVYIWWFLKKHRRLRVTLIRWSIFWKSI